MQGRNKANEKWYGGGIKKKLNAVFIDKRFLIFKSSVLMYVCA